MPHPLTRNQITVAYGIAIVADIVQFPLNAVAMTGVLAIPGEFADFIIDCMVMVATSMLIGFHWLLLPSLFIEVIPGLDLIPTWTGCVACVVKIRRGAQPQPPELPLVKVHGNEMTAQATDPIIIPPPLPIQFDAEIESRLNKLNALLERGLISQEEYDAKRKQILAEL